MQPVPLEKTRERVMHQLCEHFAVENLTTDQLQERLDRAARAATLDELRGLVADLPVMASDATTLAARGDAPPPSQIPDRQLVIAVMGGTSRSGRWTPPRELTVIALMGGAELDFREARLGPGVTELNMFVLMGGVQIVVPPGVQVEMNGIAFMGGFEERHRGVAVPHDPGAPILRVGGFAMMGGVEVEVRLPGETSGDARRRQRELRREERDARRLGRG